MTKKNVTKRPLVSVIILNWNGLDDTKPCLEHVRKSTYPNIEIIVVDNGSVDGSLPYLRKQEDIILVENITNRGFTGGHIDGYKKASGEYILLLNNDAVMDLSYIETAANILQANKKIGAVGGRAYFWNKQNELFNLTSPFYSFQTVNPVTAEGIFSTSDSGALQEVNVVSGSAVMVPRSVIEKVDYLHDRFFAYYEETDLFARMKRAGYSIIYSPDLKIWHRNGVTAQRKSSTFSYYMMMRNRFSFAVRNFERAYLWRFLKNYTKTNVKATLRAILYADERAIHWAYTKAFLYNICFGWRAFMERGALTKQLGKSHYNQQIIFEQSPLSVVIEAQSKEDVSICIEYAKGMRPTDELVLVVSSKNLQEWFKKSTQGQRISTIRLCFNRKYFKGPSIDIGALSAKSDWLVVPERVSDLATIKVHDLKSVLFALVRHGAKISVLSPAKTLIQKPRSIEVLSQNLLPFVVFHRSLLINAGGAIHTDNMGSILRALCLYGVISHSLIVIGSKTKQSARMSNYKPFPSIDTLYSELSTQYNTSKSLHRRIGLFTKLTQRFYRLFQIRNFFVWLFSAKIPLRLKLARLKNLFVCCVTLNQSCLAVELKHIRNEVLFSSETVADLELRKKQETTRLRELVKDYSSLTVFIICRDRLSPLEQLVPWLEKQGLKKIVFIDNDSAYPPLVEYLQKTPYQVLELGRNVGHTSPWSAGIIRTLLPDDFYIVTDPDVIPVSENKELIPRLLELHKKFPHHLKIGPGLNIDDLPDSYRLKNEVMQWEAQFWKDQILPGVYESGLDTTFALYKPYTHTYFIHPSLRTGKPYTARHLPWYSDTTKLTDEDLFYKLHADATINTWDKGALPERYQKELAKQKSI